MGEELYTAEQFIKAIPGTGGIITMIAKKVGCARNTAASYIAKHPTVKQAYDNECETVLDMAESKTITKMNNDDWEVIKYYLSTKGKNRGYTQRTEHTGEDGEPIKFIEVERSDSSDSDPDDK